MTDDSTTVYLVRDAKRADGLWLTRLTISENPNVYNWGFSANAEEAHQFEYFSIATMRGLTEFGSVEDFGVYSANLIQGKLVVSEERIGK